MYQKMMLTLRTKFMYLDIEELLNNILSNNIIISTLAKEELLKRDLNDLNIDNETLSKVIDKFTIEELWYIANLNYNNHFKELVIIKLNQILNYYEKLNINDFLNKKNEDKLFQLIK